MVIKTLFLINPYSGYHKHTRMIDKAERQLIAANHHITKLYSEHKRYFSTILPQYELQGFENIVVFGGDGTMHEVINGMMLREDCMQYDLMLFPAGSGNAFNHDLNCLDTETAIQRLIKKRTKKIDVMKIQCEDRIIYSFNMMGWGLVTKINILAERLRWIGDSRYTLASLCNIFLNPHQYAYLKVDGEVYEESFSFVLLMNTKYTGKGMMMAPKAFLDDGLMDVLIVRKISILNLIRLFPKIYSGQHIYSPLLEYKQCKKIELKSKTKTNLNIDGEIDGSSPFVATLMPRSVSVVV